MKRFFVAALLWLLAAPAFGQWQVTQYAIPSGRGAGVTGFTNGTNTMSDVFLLKNAATTSGPLLQLQYGKGGGFLYTPGGSANVINGQFLIDIGTGLGLAVQGISMETRIQAGTNGSAVGAQFYGIVESANVQSGASGGALGALTLGKSDVGGDVFGVNNYAWCQLVAGRSCVGAEIDVDVRVNGYGAKKGLQIVSVATDTGTISDATANVALHILAQTGGSGFATGIRFGDVASAAPISTAGALITSRAMTITSGFDLSNITFSGGRWAITHNASHFGSYNAAGLAIKNVIGLDSSDLVSIYDAAFKINSSGAVTTGLWQGTAVAVGFGGTGGATVLTARANLAIDQRTTFSNANYVGLLTDYVIAQTGTLSAARTVTLPLANSVNAGRRLLIIDESGTATSTNTISFARSGSDTINSSASTQVGINSAFGYTEFESDGSSKWTSVRVSLGSPLDVGGILSPTNGGTGIANNAASTLTISGSFATTLTITGATGVTLPTTGTLLANSRNINTTSPITGGGDLSADRTIACATCATTTNGGALSATAPITISAAGVIALTTPLGVTNGGTGTATAFTQNSVVFAGASGVYSQDNNKFAWDDTNFFLKLSRNTTSVQSPPTSTALYLKGTDATVNILAMDSYGQQNNIIYRAANGTDTSPTTLVADTSIGAFAWRGCCLGGTTYSTTNSARLAAFAAETWDATHAGAYIGFYTTAKATVLAASLRMFIADDGGVVFGNSTTSPGAGIVSVSAATASTSKTTGSLLNGGGFGNAGAIFTDTLSVITMANTATTSAVCYNTGTGLFTYDGTIGTCTVSDERLKNMGPRITGALDKLLKINGVYYTWKDQTMGAGRQIGVGAQTVERVFPELVHTDSEGKKGADYMRLTAPIIEAIRELDTKIKRLERRQRWHAH